MEPAYFRYQPPSAGPSPSQGLALVMGWDEREAKRDLPAPAPSSTYLIGVGLRWVLQKRGLRHISETHTLLLMASNP